MLLSTIHESDLAYCKKYLPELNTCDERLLVARWENTGESRLLDPSCLPCARSQLLWPIFQANHFALLACGFATLAIYCAFYLWDERTEIEESTMELVNSKEAEIVEMIAMVAAIVIFILAIMTFFFALGYPRLRS